MNAFRQLWQTITAFFRARFQGEARSRPYTYGRPDTLPIGRDYDLEIQEIPIRDPETATALIEMRDYCPEVATAIGTIIADVQSSEDGDDQGFEIAEELAEDVPVKPEVLQILNECRERLFDASTLDLIIERMLVGGDAFANLQIDFNLMQVSKMLVLPSWECFRVEYGGELQYFEQRRQIWGDDPIKIPNVAMAHFRFRRKNLYGRGLFQESIQDWQRLKDATEDLARAGREIGVTPYIHTMNEGSSMEHLLQYKSEHEKRLKQGIIPHYYLLPGATIERIGGTNPDLAALANNVILWRARIVMRSRLPFYLFGLNMQGAKDISQQPATNYSRFINSVRAALTEGISQIFKTELALKGLDPNLPENRFKLCWPKFYVNPATAATEQDSMDTEGGEEDSQGKPSTNQMKRLERMAVESV